MIGLKTDHNYGSRPGDCVCTSVKGVEGEKQYLYCLGVVQTIDRGSAKLG